MTATTTADVVIVIVGGLLGGGVNAVGAGGALLSFLALVWAGVPPQMANATNLMVMPFSFLPGLGILKTEPVDRPFKRSAVVGTLIGVVLAHIIHPSAFSAAVPWMVYAATILLIAEPIARSQRLNRYLGSLVAPRSRRVTATFLLFTSVYAGFFGGAVGTLVLVVLSFTMDWRGDFNRTNRMKIAICLMTSGVGAMGFATLAVLTGTTLIQFTAGALLVPSLAIGGFLGAKWADRLPAKKLRGGVALLSGGGATWLLLAA